MKSMQNIPDLHFTNPLTFQIALQKTHFDAGVQIFLQPEKSGCSLTVHPQSPYAGWLSYIFLLSLRMSTEKMTPPHNADRFTAQSFHKSID